ncbi:S8 family serine peptidase [Nonomuraea phyllanthi]|uniref:S8 family serine peptidase n=1 Tax=Nonomuraea phyllanthi TaxID=2219224 RepID=A0A5C4WS24_9ACTN|nr:S8 family serine peptidase [Nonomuraea phyllanthi]KAB8196363.1 S8 family serine peptidase [Nonomuraea phyllanthi]
MALPRPPLARRAGVLLTAVTVLTTGLATVPASATTPAEQATPAPSASSTAQTDQNVTLTGVRSRKVVITLITGDKVQLTQEVPGKYRVETAPGKRQGDRRVNLFTQFTPDGVFVLPDDAVAAVQAGLLDKRLFDVKYLAENGYADDVAKQLPVIVQYPEEQPEAAVKRSAAAVPASEPTQTLESIHASALDVSKTEAGAFWEAVRAQQAAGQGFARTPDTLSGGIAKIWLDAKVKADLDVSVPMIGAPQAWERGYDGTGVKIAVLDTGVDPAHPDLAGQITDSKSFVPEQAVQDLQGHGTHVASTIAGTGAASGGKYKGVASGARLVVGKVLNNNGEGQESWIIEGMEWAAHSGVKAVSMSFGGDPSDGTDPLSQAVNDLTAETGTLFVVAAGNLSNPETISTPAAADAALTVAAVDKNDKLAGFSSRGPRLDGGLKPDIAAPGVNILAARAAGTSLGSPVDEHYTGMSGTSMATPHVSGAVAIMAQQHPDWTAQQLKTALMSTSKDDGFTVYEQGAGRVDLDRATRQQVFATSGGVDFGLLDGTEEAQTGQVTYANLGDQPVTLALKAEMSGGAKLSIADATLTIPAGGTAGTTVTLEVAGLGLGTHSGAVTAEADGVQLTTPVGAVRDVPKYDLVVHTLDRDGKPRTPTAMSVVDVDGTKGELGPYRVSDVGVVVTRVPAGTVSVMQVLDWVDGDDRANRGWLFNPELTITGDTEITLDARDATQIRFSTPKTAEPLNNLYELFYQRTLPSGQVYGGTLLNNRPLGSWEKVWALPTEKVTKGGFRFTGQWEFGVPEVTMTMRTPKRTTLHPVSKVHISDPAESHANYIPFEGRKDLRVVDGGKGRPEDLAGKDLSGALVLIDAEPAEQIFGLACGLQIERMGAIRDAGAAGILAFNEQPSTCPIPLDISQKPFSGPRLPIGIPFAYVSNAEGMKVREQVARGPVTIRVEGTPVTPYSYVFKPYEEGRIPRSMHYKVTERQMHRVDFNAHSGPYTKYSYWRSGWKVDDITYTGTGPNALQWSNPMPSSRTQWLWPLAPEVVSSSGMSAIIPQGPDGYVEESRYRVNVFDRPGRTRQEWFAMPSVPGAATASDKVYGLADPDAAPLEKNVIGLPCAICVHNGNLWVTPSMVSGVKERRDDGVVFGDLQPRYELHLYRDGQEIQNAPVEPFTTLPRYPLPKEVGTYRLTARNDLQDIEWTFTAPPGEDQVRPGLNCYAWWIDGPLEQCRTTPAVFVSYDLGDSLSDENTVAAGRRHTFELEAYHGPSAAKMPRIEGVRLWTSTDDGATWQPARLKRGRDGVYTASTRYPHYRATKGAVSLKVEAWDAAGNRVKQTTLRAFNLR